MECDGWIGRERMWGGKSTQWGVGDRGGRSG